MGYSDLVTFEASNDVFEANAVPVDSDTVLIVYFDDTTGTLKTRLIDSDGTAHAADSISPSASRGMQYNRIALLKLTATLYVAAWTEASGALPILGRIAPIGVSGNTATFGTASTFGTGGAALYGPYGLALGYLSASSACLLYTFQNTAVASIDVIAIVINSITASGLTVNGTNSIDTGLSNSNATYKNLSITHSTTNKLHCYWLNAANQATVGLLTVSGTTVSLTDSATIDPTTNFTITSSPECLVTVASQKSLLVYHEYDAVPSPLYDYYALAITDDGTNITLNTDLNYRNNTVATDVPYAKGMNDGTVVVWHTDNSSLMVADILSVSGTTVSLDTAGSDQSGANVANGYDNERSLVAIASTFGGVRTGTGIFFTFASADELRYLGMAFDGSKIFLTGDETGTLKLWTIDADLLQTEIDSFGSASYAELDALTRKLNPLCFPKTTNRVWLYGRDGNGVQLQLSTDGGSNFTDVSGSWSTIVAVGAHVFMYNYNDLIAVLSNNDVYHTYDGGITWTKTGDAPGADVIVSERHPIFSLALIVASSVAGDLDLTPNDAVNFYDIAIPSGGVVNVIKKAF